ncbi:molecular chaperone TorD family protein [Azoarcus sp. DN11]|uniref:TorD/DmsD family molecular chaperone n=1 Tax=Azoarcus sp. DN11 TaxID=356837 RepID=UPI0013E3739D|nr:molecular chaperone TorD family protein [Azoarcus sp. DN11]
MWAVFAEAVKFPDAQRCDDICSGRFVEDLRSALGQWDPFVLTAVDWDALAKAGRADALPVDYTSLFDGGAGGRCPLNGGPLHRVPMAAMEEVVRFYAHFGMTLAEDAPETPDHLSVELEFVACLAYGEADLEARGESGMHYARARRDFIARHPLRTVSHACRQLADVSAAPFYGALLTLLDRCLRTDLDRLEAVHGTATIG